MPPLAVPRYYSTWRGKAKQRTHEMRQELSKSKQATIVVYALNGRAIQTVAEFDGLPPGLKALDKKRTALLSKQK